MDRLEKVIDLLNRVNKLLVYIAGIDYEVVNGYGGETISTSPERIKRIKQMFQRYVQVSEEYNIVKLPEDLSDNIRILAVSGSVDKRELLKMIADKFTRLYDDEKDYGAFFDVCTMQEQYHVADMTSAFINGIKSFIDTTAVLFDEEIKNIEATHDISIIEPQDKLKTAKDNVPLVFEYDIDYLNFLFTEDEASFKGVQYNMLVNAVATADFSDILPVWIANRRKTYAGGILRFISKGILKSEQKEWLAAASKSIGISKYAGGTRVNEAYDLWRYKLTNKIKHSTKFKGYIDEERW